MSTLKPIEQGLFFQRKNDSGYMLVGLGFVDPAVSLKERALYLLLNTDMNPHISTQIIPLGPSSAAETEDHMSINEWMRTETWVDTEQPLTSTVRFIEALPEQGGYIMFGVSPLPILALDADSQKEQWCSVKDGKLSPLAQPVIDTRGLQPGQVLNAAPVWPDREGNRYALQDKAQRSLDQYQYLHQLQLKVYAGELSRQSAADLLKADPRNPFGAYDLNNVDDSAFMNFLKFLYENGHGNKRVATPEADWRSREMASSDFLKAALKAEREQCGIRTNADPSPN